MNEETGTWTPILRGFDTAGAFVYTAQNGTYTRTGKQVTIDFEIGVTSVSALGGGELFITGLPSEIIPRSNRHGCTISHCAGGANDYLRECFSGSLINYSGGGVILARHTVRGAGVIKGQSQFSVAFPVQGALEAAAVIRGSATYQIA